MAFIPRDERGTRMRIINNGPRGLDLEDEHGNKLLETGLIGNFFESTEDPKTDFYDKN